MLTRIEIDESVEHFLARSGLDVSSVPAAGQDVMLRPTANLSTGGTAIDRTDEIHPDNALIARRAAQIVGLDIAGIDFVCPDIRKSVLETGGGIIEVNAGPGFRMHLEPFQAGRATWPGPCSNCSFPRAATGASRSLRSWVPTANRPLPACSDTYSPKPALLSASPRQRAPISTASASCRAIARARAARASC